MTDRPSLVSTAKAAAAVDVSRATLWRWWKAGLVREAAVTPSGHLRWNVEDLIAQLPIVDFEPAPPLPVPIQEERPMPIEPTTVPQQPVVATAIVTSHLGVLVGQRRDGKPPWTFIAGKCHEGESPADAAVREVKEETGLLVVAGYMPIGRRRHPDTGRDMIYMACLPVEGTEVFVGDVEELTDVQWIRRESLDEYLPGLFEPVREHLERVLP